MADARCGGEFAKSKKPRWRKLLVVGWAMYAVSFFLPVTYGYWNPGPGAEPGAVGAIWGWQALLGALLATGGNPISLLSGLSNALVLATLLKLQGSRPPKSNWLTRGLMGAALLNLHWVASFSLQTSVGYWTWVASFACIASALWMRARE